MKRKALGKGLRSLIPEAPPRAAAQALPTPRENDLHQLDIDRILPNRKQPREDFAQPQLIELAASIKRDGILQPVVVRPQGDGQYELIAGERRWRAAQIAGLLKIPAIVREVDDDRLLEVALIENVQREELNPIEEARAYQALVHDLGLTQEETAKRVGKQRSTVANSLRLLNLPREIQDRVRTGDISVGHAKVLAAISNPDLQRSLAERVADEGLSVRQIELLASRKNSAGSSSPGRKAKERDPNVVAAEEKLQTALGTKVRIVQARKGGRLELYYFSDEELSRVYDLILRATNSRKSSLSGSQPTILSAD